MSRGLATVVYAIGISGMFLLARERSSRVTAAVWIPAAWLAIGASRSVSEWLGRPSVSLMESAGQYLEGSPLDAAVFAGLELAAVMVLVARQGRLRAFARDNGPLIAFFAYCVVSVLWSDYPFVAFKRWTKAIGNLLMVLVVLTEPDPPAAMRALLTRTGFVLVPLSVLFIKYYPELGRGFDAWTGAGYNQGVGTNKNGLGVVCLVFGLGSMWQFLGALHVGPLVSRAGPLIAHGAALVATVWLFSMADSATSLGCFLVGTAVMALARWRGRVLRRGAMHVLLATIAGLCVFGLLVDTDVGLVQMFGRNGTLTTRTDLWQALLRIPVNPLFGAGFESFWLGERVELLWKTYWWHPNQAHNGYLEFYLNGGWLGIAVLGWVILCGYQNVLYGLQRDRELGGLRLAFFMAAILYNLTEASFKVIHPVWVAFLIAVAVSPNPAIWSRRPRSEGLPASAGGADERAATRAPAVEDVVAAQGS